MIKEIAYGLFGGAMIGFLFAVQVALRDACAELNYTISKRRQLMGLGVRLIWAFGTFLALLFILSALARGQVMHIYVTVSFVIGIVLSLSVLKKGIRRIRMIIAAVLASRS